MSGYILKLHMDHANGAKVRSYVDGNGKFTHAEKAARIWDSRDEAEKHKKHMLTDYASGRAIAEVVKIFDKRDDIDCWFEAVDRKEEANV